MSALLTPSHTCRYTITWKHQFPAASCNTTAATARIRLQISVDNLVLWSKVIDDTATATDAGYKIKAVPLGGDELHFVAGWEKATLRFEATPLTEDGCAVAIDNVRVASEGQVSEVDLRSNASAPLLDAEYVGALAASFKDAANKAWCPLAASTHPARAQSAPKRSTLNRIMSYVNHASKAKSEKKEHPD